MSEVEQSQPAGFSESEKAMLLRAIIIGLIASAITLWLGDVFDADGPSFFSIEVVLAFLASFIVAGVFSVMGESVIEDIVKLAMIGVIFWFTRKYPAFDLVTMGLMVGGVAGFFNNRLPRKSNPKTG